MQRIVIVGGGFGGAYCAARLEKLLRRRMPSRAGDAGDVEVVLVDRRNYFLFYPLLIEAGTGSLEPRHAVVSIRSFLRRSRFLMAAVTDVDFERRCVRYRLAPIDSASADPPAEATIDYDQLVLAPGSITLMPDSVPGLREHAFEIKGVEDAVALRDRAIQLLERADATVDEARRRALLHFVIVGANFTGAELAGEFHAFLRRVARQYPNLSPRECNVTLVERDSRILRALRPELSQYAEERMRARGIEIRLNETVASVDTNSIMLAGGEHLDASTIIWCAGIAPAPLVGGLDLPKDGRGYVLCKRDCRVQGMEAVWAIGDSAVNVDAAGNAYPATAQHAVREGEHVAANIVRMIDGGQSTPFDYQSQGSLAALGCRTGVAQFMGLKLSGFPAWWLWRTVYLLKMPGVARKLRVSLDWTLDLFFRRDDVQLGVHQRERYEKAKEQAATEEVAA